MVLVIVKLDLGPTFVRTARTARTFEISEFCLHNALATDVGCLWVHDMYLKFHT